MVVVLLASTAGASAQTAETEAHSPTEQGPVDEKPTEDLEPGPPDPDEQTFGPEYTVEELLPTFASQRALLGFDAIPVEKLRELANSTVGEKSIEDWGFVLTTDEQRELVLRDTTADSVREAIVPIADQLDGFAGIYSANYKVVVGFTGAVNAESKSQMLSAVEHPERVVIRENMPFTREELEMAAADAREQFVAVDSASVDVEFGDGAIEIRVPADSLSRALALTLEHPAIRVVEDNSIVADSVCNYRWQCYTPLRGGTNAKNTDRPSQIPCTSGAVFRKDNGGVDYMSTAAHCTDFGDNFKIGTYGGSGQVFASNIGSNKSEDTDTHLLIIPATQTSYRFFRNSATKFRPFKWRRANNQIDEDDIVCVHSHKVLRTCGPITDTSQDESGGVYATDDNFTFTVSLPGHYDCSDASLPGVDEVVAGTSGAPVTNETGFTIVGFQHACDLENYTAPIPPATIGVTTARLWASKAENVETDLEATIRLE